MVVLTSMMYNPWVAWILCAAAQHVLQVLMLLRLVAHRAPTVLQVNTMRTLPLQRHLLVWIVYLDIPHPPQAPRRTQVVLCAMLVIMDRTYRQR